MLGSAICPCLLTVKSINICGCFPIVQVLISFFSNSSSLYLIYEDKIFDQIKNDSSKLISLGFPPSVLKEVATDFSSKPNIKCMSQRVIDKNNTITSAFVLSNTISENCVKQLIYNIIGITNVSNDSDGLVYSCVLYEARKKGYRDAVSVNSHINELLDACSPGRVN